METWTIFMVWLLINVMVNVAKHYFLKTNDTKFVNVCWGQLIFFQTGNDNNVLINGPNAKCRYLYGTIVTMTSAILSLSSFAKNGCRTHSERPHWWQKTVADERFVVVVLLVYLIFPHWLQKEHEFTRNEHLSKILPLAF